MPKRRLLVVDDSVVIRQALSAGLSGEKDLEVVGSASNGRVALMKIALLHPDLVLLDVEMAEMSGLETLAAIRQTYPRLPVIMLSVPTAGGTAETVDALTRGANGYVIKPPASVPSAEALKVFCAELASKVHSCCPRSSDDGASSRILERATPPDAARRTGAGRRGDRVDVVAIGASTGGPNALMDLLPRFPPDFPVPVLIVQHMPPMFTKLLAERLAAKARIPVAEGRPSQPLTPGRAWMAPGDFHMAVERNGETVRILTHRSPPENSCRPSADVLFRSVAQVYGPRVLAVVMTGMGQDGLRGCEQIQAAGGQVLVQDEVTSVVWGMPGFVVRAGMADEVLSLGDLGAEILERVWRHRQNHCATR